MRDNQARRESFLPQDKKKEHLPRGREEREDVKNKVIGFIMQDLKAFLATLAPSRFQGFDSSFSGLGV
jgi:hypothetical protein